MPGFARWVLGGPDLDALPALRKGMADELRAALATLKTLCGGDLGALKGQAVHERLGAAGEAALRLLARAYLLNLSPTPAGDPVARFHLDNGARLERLNLHGNMSSEGLRQSFGVMVNYVYDLDKVEASHDRFRRGEVAHSRAFGHPH
jgi:malonyl-CoA decarboxylase